MFKSINLKEALAQENSKINQDSHLLQEVKNLLQTEAQNDQRILNQITGKQVVTITSTSIDYSVLDPNLMYAEEAIFNLCSRFRLRFLDSKLFKGEIPYEALVAIKQLEQKLNVKLKIFKVIAPASRFQLKDSMEDPILVAKLANGTYYFIHQWGTELAWHKQVYYYPFRNITTLAISASLLAFLLIWILPTPLTTSTTAMFVLGKMYSWLVFSGMIFTTALIVGIIAISDFSENVWDSKFFR